ncbi:phosphate/phosphite/phosphonate ABC transporter substrate-binding protein [Demequina gelatinilytica]|uniref:phosphate/phosphite/phosphonate ABC transporter substrate-binding protein n=1 Tax=Demequina gelatinilytica TaxID=1638980 RepID=UPI0007837693|nr:phosphate/phosphite/phosphonate ABC transporter substrate-binding protein [Demequina gelatinilytica]
MIRSRKAAGVAAGAAFAAALLAGCSGASANETPDVLKLGVPPGEADAEYLEMLEPLAGIIEEATGIPVELTETGDYLGIVEAMRSDLIDMAIFSPFPAVLAQKVADVELIAAATGAPYSSLIICSTASGVEELADITADTTIAFVDPGSTSGNFIPKLVLKEAGVDIDGLTETYAGGHDTAALAVMQGSADCAAVASQLWDYMVEAGALDETLVTKVAESDPIPISTVVVGREGLSEEIYQQVADVFVGSTEADVLQVMGGATEVIDPDDADWTIFEDAAKELGVNLEDVE